jgi:peptidoglycan/xylan/chitin deacetylase (PgdA/CDA1 family)
MRNQRPIVSFSFDDFPASALEVGGDILASHGRRGTFYASFGLVGQMTPVGKIFEPGDLLRLSEQGHELGCHTFDHRHSWTSSAAVFEQSIEENAIEARRLGWSGLKTFSFPLHCPHPRTKQTAARHFDCCRCGGQTFNRGIADFNHLNAYFIEQNRGDVSEIERLIDANAAAAGWLIFATHDVSAGPTPYGCTASLFDRIVKASLRSGADVLTVADAAQAVSGVAFQGLGDAA